MIIFFAVTALVVFRLSGGAKTDTRKARVITVATAVPLKQDLDIRLTYTADITPTKQSICSPGSTATSQSSTSTKATWLKPTSF